MGDRMALVLARADGAQLGAVAQVLAECGHQCWIGQSALNASLDPGLNTRTICLECALVDPECREALEESGVHVLPGVREEVAGLLGEKRTDRIFKTLNVKE